MVLIADIGGTNCRFELWDIDLQDRTQHREIFHIVRHPRFSALPGSSQVVHLRDELVRHLCNMSASSERASLFLFCCSQSQ